MEKVGGKKKMRKRIFIKLEFKWRKGKSVIFVIIYSCLFNYLELLFIVYFI